MPFDPWLCYEKMLFCRMFEESVMTLWKEGHISGEMHLGTGEEAIIAGIGLQLEPDDAMALDHRGTAAMLVKGVEPYELLAEMLGRSDGLCCGMGGHMHLFSEPHLSASSGIVGSEGPAAAGFALAARCLRPGSIAVAFFGEGAMNQGMLMESLNLAAAWELPVLFVCKDDNWSITQRSDEYTGGSLSDRSDILGVDSTIADGRDVETVWNTAAPIIQNIREKSRPHFLKLSCVHLEGHFLGYELMRTVQNPLRNIPHIAKPLTQSFLTRPGGSIKERLEGLKMVTKALLDTIRDPRTDVENDPLIRIRSRLPKDSGKLTTIETRSEDLMLSLMGQILPELEQS